MGLQNTTDMRHARLMFSLLQYCKEGVYKIQQTCEMRDLCDNIARMCLRQNTTNTPRTCEMHDARLMFSLLQYCKDGVTKYNKHARCVIFVTTLQGWAYKTPVWRPKIARFQGWVKTLACQKIAMRISAGAQVVCVSDTPLHL